MSKILCIDLGSTNSAMAIYEGGSSQIITNSEGGRTTPSIVAFTNSGEQLVGNAAQRQMVVNAKNTITIVKRLMGKKFSDLPEGYVKSLPYSVVAAPNGDCRIDINGKLYSPEEISAKILAKLKSDAEAYLGEKIDDAIITIPAYFGPESRAATQNAGLIAGFKNIRRIVSEPTAAIMAYTVNKKTSKKIAVVDFGGSTFDVSVAEVGDGVTEVLAVNGIIDLGGHEIDSALMNFVISEFRKDSGIDVSNDPMAVQRIKDACEQAKCALSNTTTHDISLPFITADSNGPKHLTMTITRARLEELSRDIVNRMVEPCKKCLEDAGNPKIDEVLLVGGQTRMPLIVETVKNIFGIEPTRNINPDEAVALGAAVQGGILEGGVKDLLLLDVTPLSLSIRVNQDISDVLIPRNSTIPCKQSRIYTNASPMQSMATIMVATGERKLFGENKLLGQFNVELVPNPTVGGNQIEVCFDMSQDSILTVTAKDLALNKPANITITNSSGLSKEEVDRMIADAEKYAAEDAKRVELVNLKNHSDSLCDQIEKTLKDAGDKISSDERKTVEDAVAKVRESTKTDDSAAIKAATEALNKAWEPVVAKLYPKGAQQFSQADFEKMKNNPEFMNQFSQMFGNQGGNPFGAGGFAAGNATGGPKNDDGPIEAEVVE